MPDWAILTEPLKVLAPVNVLVPVTAAVPVTLRLLPVARAPVKDPVPETRALPVTWSFSEGVVVPMPTLPLSSAVRVLAPLAPTVSAYFARNA